MDLFTTILTIILGMCKNGRNKNIHDFRNLGNICVLQKNGFIIHSNDSKLYSREYGISLIFKHSFPSIRRSSKEQYKKYHACGSTRFSWRFKIHTTRQAVRSMTNKMDPRKTILLTI